MKPTVAALSGPLEGSTFPLADTDTTIGRDKGSQIRLPDPSVSRRHCVIRRDGGAFVLKDLESTNGTFVNGVPIGERQLEHGDHIAICDSLFVVLFVEHVRQHTEEVLAPTVNDLAVSPTVEMGHQETRYLQDAFAEQVPQARMARDLHALLGISAKINSIRRLDLLQERLLELVFDVVPAQRGAIILLQPQRNEFRSLVGRDRGRGSVPITVSRPAIDRVLQTGKGLLSGTPEGQLTDVSSLLCLPLRSMEDILGVIYLETTHPEVPFDQEHLEFTSAIAAISGAVLESVGRLERLESQCQLLQQDIDLRYNMVGESEPMRRVYEFIAKVAPTDATVLITGENGTGKELVARALHRSSPRSQGPFVAINCAVLTDELLANELFGHVKGAFTSAVGSKGKLEVAQGGSVLLDEIGELAPALQAKLLRVLQEGEFERVGGNQPIPCDIRVIASTNRNLEQAMEAGEFRQDFYYRINVVSIPLPALRERRDDIPLLAQYFVSRYSRERKRAVAGISPEAREALIRYHWPGNVRELQNAIERAIVLGNHDIILPEDLPDSILASRTDRGTSGAYHEALQNTKQELILDAFRRCRGSYTEAAGVLGIHPNYLHRLVRNLKMRGTLRKAKAELISKG